MLNQKEFAARRQRVMDQMKEDSIAFIPSSHELIRTGDTHFRFRQHSDFYYLTGFDEPEAVAVLIPGEKKQYILFNRKRDPLMEQWNGLRAGQEGARKNYAADDAFEIEEFHEMLPKLLENRRQIYCPIGRDHKFDHQVIHSVNQIRSQVRSGVSAPAEFISIENVIHPLRLLKSEAEIQLMRKAGSITANAHKKAMKICKPGMYEYEIEAELLYEFHRHGCKSEAYGSIVGGGANACILHYFQNDSQLKDGDLLLVDAGGEYELYSSDVTRTFPVNGRFTAEQRALYEVVLQAQLASIKKVKTGNTWGDMHDTSVRVLTEGLVDLKILKGNVDDLIANKDYFRFYMHRTGHWLGLDTHDVGSYKSKSQDKWMEYQPGMVTTVEPGLYISAGMEGVDEKWWNLGIRIEDNVLVTPQGNEIFTSEAPKTCDDIEAVMRG